MLPPYLVSIYGEYKKDITSIASWLAITAKECGYSADLLNKIPAPGFEAQPVVPKPEQQQAASQTEQQTAASQIKEPSIASETTQEPASIELAGNAKAGAKKKNKRNKKKSKATSSSEDPLPRYLIEAEDLVLLAEYISAHKTSALSVPKAFFNTIDRVISVRSVISKKIVSQNTNSRGKSDAKHPYFVGILEKVREILKAFLDPNASTSSDFMDNMTYFFVAEEIYEPSEKFLKTPGVQKSQATQSNISVYDVYVIDLSKSLDKAMIAFCMMYKDLNEIRSFLSLCWDRLRRVPDSFDPAVLAVLTNSSIDFAQGIADEVATMFEEHGGMTNMAKEYMARVRATRRKSRKDSANADEIELFNSFYKISRAIETLALVPWEGNTAVCLEGIFDALEDDTKTASKSVNQKFEHDNMITAELWFEALALLHNIPDYFITDEFIRGVKEFKETNKVPFSLVFAAQVNIDIHRAIRSYAEPFVVNLLTRVDLMKGLLGTQINLHKDMKSPHWSDSDQKWLQDTEKRFGWFLNDPLYMAKKKAMGNDPEGPEKLANTGKHRLLLRSPILSGLALYYYRAEMHKVGLKASNAWGTSIPCAQLYYYVASSDSSWIDMFQLQEMFGEEQFQKDLDTADYKDYEARYMLQIGGSGSPLTDRSPTEPTRINNSSRANAMILRSRAFIHHRLKDRYQKNGNRMNWSPECIKEIIARSELEEHGKKKKKSNRKNKKTGPATNKDVRLSSTHLLAHLNVAMEGEMEELAFPYLLMHRTTWRLLSTVKSRYKRVLEQVYGPFGMEKWQTPFVVGAILKLDDEGFRVIGGELLQFATNYFNRMDEIAVTYLSTTQMGTLLYHPFDLSPEFSLTFDTMERYIYNLSASLGRVWF
ncbi:hypothetical protein ACHAO9_011603 [Fusarium lateritium]